MATLTATEQRRLGVIRPDLMQKLLQLMDIAHDQGWVVFIPDDAGYRSIAKQQALYADSLAQGGGQLAYAVGTPGKSRHNYGAAFDIHIEAPDDTDENYRQLADFGQSLGLVAGYYFADRGVGLKDPFHFQLDETLQESIDRWNAMKTAGILKGAGIVIAVVLAASLLRP